MHPERIQVLLECGKNSYRTPVVRTIKLLVESASKTPADVDIAHILHSEFIGHGMASSPSSNGVREHITYTHRYILVRTAEGYKCRLNTEPCMVRSMRGTV